MGGCEGHSLQGKPRCGDGKMKNERTQSQVVHSIATEGVRAGISGKWLWRDELRMDFNIVSKFELYLVSKVLVMV